MEIFLFIFSMLVIVLTIIYWIYESKHKRNDNNAVSDFLESARSKLKGSAKTKRNRFYPLFKSPSDRRRDYYRNEYLKSEEWQRKRYVVLKRDNWCCVYCGGRATQVHHKRYAKRNIGNEPIAWLVSVCRSCHERQHNLKK